MKTTTNNDRYKVISGIEMRKRIDKLRMELKEGDILIMKYGCGEHMLGEYCKLKTPLIVEVEQLYDHHFVVAVIGRLGHKIRYSYTYADLEIGELISCFR